MLTAIAQLEPRTEGWVWWIILVLALGMFLLLLVSILRRHLVRPMPLKPSDTTDAWREAGRRLPVPPPDGEADESSEDDRTS
jgi:hypothetical protein